MLTFFIHLRWSGLRSQTLEDEILPSLRPVRQEEEQPGLSSQREMRLVALLSILFSLGWGLSGCVGGRGEGEVEGEEGDRGGGGSRGKEGREADLSAPSLLSSRLSSIQTGAGPVPHLLFIRAEMWKAAAEIGRQ